MNKKRVDVARWCRLLLTSMAAITITNVFFQRQTNIKLTKKSSMMQFLLKQKKAWSHMLAK